VFCALKRRVDMSGVLDIEELEPWEAIVLHCDAPEAAARAGISALLARGVVTHRDRKLVIPNHLAAETASKSDAQRQRETRERKRLEALAPPTVTERDSLSSQNVTKPSQPVTPRHDVSQPVTTGHSVLCCAVLPSAVLPSAEESCEGVAVAPPLAAPVAFPTSAGTERKRKPAQPKDPLGSQLDAGACWLAYAAAYRERYGADPVRNAKVNGQVAQFCKRIPAAEAPDVAAHYVRSQNARYVAAGHAWGPLLQDAEKLRTEWLTGRSVAPERSYPPSRAPGPVSDAAAHARDAEKGDRWI
jgi:hypothetical protein